MAIDTAAKRRNVANVPWWAAGVGVTPDATPGVEWRQQAGWGYSGIAAGGVVTPDVMAMGSNWLRRPAGRLVR